MSTLTSKESLCVSDIAKIASASITNTSHHLNLLEHLGFVAQERRGKEVYYSLSDDCIEDIIRRASDHVSGT
ncbi:MAG: ArsR/SmtB family transcription factor [Candidatus Thorarchaeota archaeon]